MGLEFSSLCTNARRAFVNVGTLSMCLTFNSPILDSATDPSSPFMGHTIGSSKPSVHVTTVAMEPGSKTLRSIASLVEYVYLFHFFTLFCSSADAGFNRWNFG